MTTVPVFDGHNDTLLRLHGERQQKSFFERGERGHIDLSRAREGGLGGGLFACFVPNRGGEGQNGEPPALKEGDREPLDPSCAQRTAGALARTLFELEASSGGSLKVARTTGEIEACLRDGVLAAVLHYEGAENLGPDPSALEELYEKGLRSLGLVWSRPNAYGHGVPFRFPSSPDTGPGLTDAGRELVRECNRLGVLVDLSHLNERGFWDVARITEAPLVATHSNAHALCPASRNLTDRQLDAIRDSDGMVGVNFAAGFLRPDGRDEEDTPLAEIARHVDYLVERLGIERVGFGSDFDGARIPRELGDASGLPRLLDALRERGYGEAELRKLAHQNWLRVLRATWGA
ncbi:hypothetical protein Rxycam_02776 [Rubrobacter xylanophilus DSM 9941]|uniref:dipeptidase n=1 Tax=Rubrobacter xylanophilus TaxID=49319 RepID=UPI001C63CD10|nr:dipeptidase [Rubrobacter xylanophilus]QYJ16940.1 hypothetical protein Rxycam_02776 [Rubrobacter xylanophilus DSM 9941]